MTKQQYLIYNEATRLCIFYEGEQQHNKRDFFVDGSLINHLEKIVDKKRKTDLIIRGIDKDILIKLKRKYEGTKINLIFE